MRTIFHPFGLCGGGGQREFAVFRKRESLGKISAKAEMRTIFLLSQKNPSVPLPAQTKKPPEDKLREAFALERATRIGLATEAWEAPILPLNYARIYRVAYLTQPCFYILLYLP